MDKLNRDADIMPERKEVMEACGDVVEAKPVKDIWQLTNKLSLLIIEECVSQNIDSRRMMALDLTPLELAAILVKKIRDVLTTGEKNGTM